METSKSAYRRIGAQSQNKTREELLKMIADQVTRIEELEAALNGRTVSCVCSGEAKLADAIRERDEARAQLLRLEGE